MLNGISWLLEKAIINRNKKDDLEIDLYSDKRIKDFKLYIIDENGYIKKYKIKDLKDFIDNFEQILKKDWLTVILFHKEPSPWLQIRSYVSGEADIVTFSDKEAEAFIKLIKSLGK